ncbi:hypothetical protein [Sulfuricella sp.]|uniref:hypothetical protein n=1 Tax=Sulfuricella sp. TaxID=2099377 RepID=UPI002CDF5306|nr:hypothetical protein [Sulfuricella sp.]HUX64329.1 hypothetical protein [Sulfuricella sp.]
MNRAIQHQDVLNIKTRFRLFFLSIIFGLVVGAASGWQWTHKGMSTVESDVFDIYTQAWTYQQTGFGNLSIQNSESGSEGLAMVILPIEKTTSEKHLITATEFLNFMHQQHPKIAQEFDKKSMLTFVYLPVVGALAGAALLLALTGLMQKEERN